MCAGTKDETDAGTGESGITVDYGNVHTDRYTLNEWTRPIMEAKLCMCAPRPGSLHLFICAYVHVWRSVLCVYVCVAHSCQILSLIDELYLDYRVSAFLRCMRRRFAASPQWVPPTPRTPSTPRGIDNGGASPRAEEEEEETAASHTLTEEEVEEVESLFSGEAAFSLLQVCVVKGHEAFVCVCVPV